MGQETGISWTDHTFNPWWGCSRVSPGCEHCYAETFAKRVGHGKGGSKLPLWGVDEERKPASEKTWKELSKWNESASKAGVRRRVFVASMADIFEITPERNAKANDIMSAGRERLWKAIAECTSLDFQLLTKRPENVRRLAPWPSPTRDDDDQLRQCARLWPRNVWVGTTVENQKAAENRIPFLLEIPSAVRFVSAEPLLERVDLTHVVPYYLTHRDSPNAITCAYDALRGHIKGPDEMVPFHVDWVIVGGESGPGARQFDPTWAFEILHECKVAGVAAWFKQLGENYYPKFPGSPFKARKGDDPSEWPVWLSVQQLPKVVA
jgi:protein gp37